MLNVAFVVYRQWGYDIYKNIYEFNKNNNKFRIKVLIVNKENDQIKFKKLKTKKFIVNPNDNEKIQNIFKKNNIDLAFFYSWSFIIPGNIYKNYVCLCLHPSPLPKFRGGSPIQNQLIAGEKKSAVTIFKIGESIDGGDIYKQMSMTLAGDINDIFSRMVKIGTLITKKVLIDANRNQLKFIPQKNVNKFPVHKRRSPKQSIFSLDEIENMTFEHLNNFVRGLLYPYPELCITLGNFNIRIKKIKKVSRLPNRHDLIKDDLSLNNNSKIIKLLDSYAQIVDYRVENL